jgi:formylglycine-generating enzyme required for sulfatase activity
MRLIPVAPALLAILVLPRLHADEPALPSAAATAESVVKYLSGWASGVGDDRDGPTGFPKRIRRTKDGMLMVLVPAGTFQMGAVPGDEHSSKSELPRHPVTLTKSYYMDECEVTVGMWKAYVKDRGLSLTRVGANSTDRHPKVGLSWDDVQAYVAWVGVVLPTEAQWERAAKAGHDDYIYPWGTNDDVKKRNGPGSEDGQSSLAPAKSFEANEYGLYDLAGNAWEWCSDTFELDYYTRSPSQDPSGPLAMEMVNMRVMRGGAWTGLPKFLRVSNREAVPQTSGVTVVQGFRGAKGLP